MSLEQFQAISLTLAASHIAWGRENLGGHPPPRCAQRAPAPWPGPALANPDIRIWERSRCRQRVVDVLTQRGVADGEAPVDEALLEHGQHATEPRRDVREL